MTYCIQRYGEIHYLFTLFWAAGGILGRFLRENPLSRPKAPAGAETSGRRGRPGGVPHPPVPHLASIGDHLWPQARETLGVRPCFKEAALTTRLRQLPATKPSAPQAGRALRAPGRYLAPLDMRLSASR